MSRRDVEFDAISEADIFQEARDRLQIVMDAESRTRPAAKEAIKFCWGDQWADVVSGSVSQAETIELTINFTGMLVRRVVNNMKQQRPRGKCHPVGDGAQIEIAEIINGIGRHVEYRSEAGVAYDTAGDMAAKAGWGYCRMIAEYVAADSFQRDIRILPIFNIFTVYLDPAAMMPTASDMNWGFITIKMKRTEYKRLYPKADNAEWKAGDDDRSSREWEDKEEIRLAEYFRIRETSAKLYQLCDMQGNPVDTRFKDELPSEVSMAAAGLQITDIRDSSRKQVEWFRLNGTKVVDREILPGEYIPIIRCINEQVDNDGEILRAGIVKAVMDPQRMVNYGEVAKIKRLALTPQAPWIYAEGQLDGHPEWTDTNNRAHPALGYKPITISTAQGEVPLPPPTRQQPAQIEAGFAEFTEGMRSNLLSIAGMQNEPGQDTRGQVVSGLAQQRRDKTSDMAHFQLYDNQTLMIAQVWRIMLSWIPYYFKEKGRIQRIIGEDGVPDMVTLNAPGDDPAMQKVKNDLTVGRYDVVMDTGPGYETKREEGAETFMELLNSPMGELIAKVGPDLAIRSIDHPYMQELADRFSAMTPDGLKKVMEQLPERAKAIVQALANENNSLKQQLQAAQSGITKAHLDATVKAHDVEETNKTHRLDTESRERTALTVQHMKEHGAQGREEIKAGAELLGKKLDHAQAERLVDKGEANGDGSHR